MLRHHKRCTACAVLLLTIAFFLPALLFAQNTGTSVYFFATVTSTPDDPTIKLTENLFYTQFQTENVGITDMRPSYITDYTQGTVPHTDLPESAILFGLELQKENSGWVCRLNILRQKDVLTGNTSPFCFENTYESYYKILMDTKNLIGQVLSYQSSATEPLAVESQTAPAATAKGLFNLDNLAGTWKGESLIDKIIILRSGRGFVIFNNGASMNISITLKGNILEAVQTGKPNASFFPDLPREVALAAATRAEPVSWNLSLSDADTLSGTKTTLLPSETDSSNAERKSVSVTWKRL